MNDQGRSQEYNFFFVNAKNIVQWIPKYDKINIKIILQVSKNISKNLTFETTFGEVLWRIRKI